MKYSNSRIRKSLNDLLTKDTIIKTFLFIIPLISIVLKGIFLQGFIGSENPYEFNFLTGYSLASPCLSYYIAFASIFLSFSFLFKNKGKIIYIFTIDLILTLLFIVDLWYFRGFLTVPSVLILTQTANLDNMGGSILSMLSSLDFIFLLDFIVLAIYVYLTRNSYSKERGRRSIILFLITFIAPLLFILYIPFNIHVLKNENVKGAYLFDSYDPTNTTRYFSSIGYHIIDAFTVYKDSKPYAFTSEDTENINKLYEIKNENLPDNEYFGMSKGKNLIYIQVESLEDFVIGKSINGQEITPVLNNIITKSLYFPNIFEQVNEGTSSDCDLMVNTSMLPLRRGCTFFRYPGTNYNSLPKILQNNGYSTIAIHPDKGSFWNYSNALTQGIAFEKFKDYFSFNDDESIGMGISDRTYFEQVVPMLQEEQQPFYTLNVTLTSHGPFDIPEEYRVLGLDPELDKSELGGYFESIHYTDAQIGHYLELLDQAGLLQNSVIAIMGDHTGVHKYYNSSINSLSSKEDWYLDNGNPVVPLIIYDPSMGEGKTFDLYGGQVDVMPTLLYLLGIPKDQYENTALGRNLLNTQKSFAILTNGTLKGEENLTEEEQNIYKQSLELSDKMIRANHPYK